MGLWDSSASWPEGHRVMELYVASLRPDARDAGEGLRLARFIGSPKAEPWGVCVAMHVSTSPDHVGRVLPGPRMDTHQSHLRP